MALAGVAQLVGHHPTNQKVESSILGQGTCLGCRFSPRLCKRQPIDVSHTDVSVPLFSPSLSLRS